MEFLAVVHIAVPWQDWQFWEVWFLDMHRTDSCETVRSASEIYSVINSVYSFDSVWQESHCESISASRLHVCIMTSGKPKWKPEFSPALASTRDSCRPWRLGTKM